LLCFSFVAKNFFTSVGKYWHSSASLTTKSRILQQNQGSRQSVGLLSRQPVAKGLGSQNTGGLSTTHLSVFMNTFLL